MRNKLFRLATSTIVAGVMASIVLSAMPQQAMAAAPPAPYSNGFENSGDVMTPAIAGETQAMFDVNRVSSGTDGITAASGSWFAQAPANGFTRLGGYSNTFPTGGFTTSVDVYLDMTKATGSIDLRFDWSSAISDPTGAHRRDFIFNVGTDPTTAGTFVMSASNNTPGWPANPDRDPFKVNATGWYTFQNTFVNEAGVLADHMSVLNSSGTPLHTWILSDPSDLIGTTVGGNRYAGLFNNQFVGLALDDINRTGTPDPIRPTTGSWSQYPNSTTEYQAAVQQPINTANTSNWSSKSKGAIPVMFKLSSKAGPAVFESIFSDNPAGGPANTANDYAYASFSPDELTFSQIDTLKADYQFTLGNCHGGSLRWEIGTEEGNVFVYYGDGPNFTDCKTNNQSDINMVGFSDLRWDTSQVGGTFYDTHANAVALIGNENVNYAALIVDSGWQHQPTTPGDADQRATVSNITVNDSVYQWDAGGSGDFAATCDLPDATIKVLKGDPVVDGNINEEPVQASLADDGNAFRVVDCKYQYILSIPSLDGKGTYQVQIRIDGGNVPTPGSPGGKVKFDIK